MVKSGRSIPLAACVLLAASHAVAAPDVNETVSMTRTGTAAGQGLGAIDAATREAHTAMVVEVLDTVLLSDDFTLVKPLIEHADAYIASSYLVDTSFNEGVTTVEVDATVRKGAIRRAAAGLILEGAAAPPRVLLLVAERSPDGTWRLDTAGPVQEQLEEAFEDAGVILANSQPLRDRYGVAGLLDSVMAEGPEPSAALALEALADVAVVGTAEAVPEEAERQGNVVPVRAAVTLRIVRAVDRTAMHTSMGEQVVWGADLAETAAMALEDACTRVYADAIVHAIVASVTAGEVPGFLVTLEAPGPRSRVEAVLARLRSVEGVESAEELHYTDVLARIRVVYNGPIRPLVDALTQTAYDGFRLRAHVVVADEMTFTVEGL